MRWGRLGVEFGAGSGEGERSVTGMELGEELFANIIYL